MGRKKLYDTVREICDKYVFSIGSGRSPYTNIIHTEKNTIIRCFRDGGRPPNFRSSKNLVGIVYVLDKDVFVDSKSGKAFKEDIKGLFSKNNIDSEEITSEKARDLLSSGAVYS